MAYTVSLSGSAEADAYAAFEHIREVAPASAARWLTGLFAAIRTLNRSTRDSDTRCHGNTGMAGLRVLPVCQCCVA